MKDKIVCCSVCGAGVALPPGFNAAWKYRCPDCYDATRKACAATGSKVVPPNVVVREDAFTEQLRSLAVQVEELRRVIEAYVA